MSENQDRTMEELLSGNWTFFWDMHSGGSLKTEWHFIAIQAGRDNAVQYANWKWNIHEDNVTCTCCGNDFSVFATDKYNSWDDEEKDNGNIIDLIMYHFVKQDEQYWNFEGEVAPDKSWPYKISREDMAKRILNHVRNEKVCNRDNNDSFHFVFADQMEDGGWQKHETKRHGYVWSEW